MGQVLHMIQDSYSESHVTRTGGVGAIELMQSYGDQDESQHGIADKAVGSPQYMAARVMSSWYLQIMLCPDDWPSTSGNLNVFFDHLLRLAPGAKTGGTDPHYKKVPPGPVVTPSPPIIRGGY
jgi:hypothetical protein